MRNLLSAYDWDNWIYGMWIASVSGGAQAAISGLGLNLTDPAHFNAQTWAFYRQILIAFGMGFAIAFLLFLKQNPAPKVITKTEVTGTKTVTAPSGEQTVTVVEKTVTVAMPAEPPKPDPETK